ncbi:MOSC domain-containing protein [Kitasatospora sp. NPDC048365]|uniref:MOSC domain-containing protein n=1 Tax=Kitasatospora sp. NPDC048365 TaxID=3364050 RepID=UPI0037164292
MKLLSVNVGKAVPVEYTDAPSGTTGVDKRPVDGPVRLSRPGPKGVGASGVAGDDVCDLRFHGGPDRAAYAYAREDLDFWEDEANRAFAAGSFGENLTMEGVDVTNALIGERWQVGGVLVEVTGGRIPCRTFQGFLAEQGWVKRFTRAGRPGALLRVIEEGEVRAGDPITVVHRPAHAVTVGTLFHAATLDRTRLAETLVAAEWMESGLLGLAREYAAKYGSA